LDILYLLVPITLGLITLAVVLFYWTVKSGQYDDLDSQAHRILFDDNDDMTPPEARISKSDVKKTITKNETLQNDPNNDD